MICQLLVLIRESNRITMNSFSDFDCSLPVFLLNSLRWVTDWYQRAHQWPGPSRHPSPGLPNVRHESPLPRHRGSSGPQRAGGNYPDENREKPDKPTAANMTNTKRKVSEVWRKRQAGELKRASSLTVAPVGQPPRAWNCSRGKGCQSVSYPFRAAASHAVESSWPAYIHIDSADMPAPSCSQHIAISSTSGCRMRGNEVSNSHSSSMSAGSFIGKGKKLAGEHILPFMRPKCVGFMRNPVRWRSGGFILF